MSAAVWLSSGRAVKVPLLMPLVGGTYGWAWVSCCRSTCQVKALAGMTPSSGSVALPTKPMIWFFSQPMLDAVPLRSAGSRIVGTGSWLLLTVSRASLLVVVPLALVTLQRNLAPLSPATVVVRVYVVAVA